MTAPEPDDFEPCDHICEDFCEDEYGELDCTHQHCWHCGQCGCPGYCDDVQTYNLRPAETGGSPSYPQLAADPETEAP